MRRPSGFTLIELLVVVAIITLVVGILLPALAKARKASQLAASLSNLHQISLALVTYRNESKDYLPYPVYTNPNGTADLAVWQYGGKYCHSRWASTPADIPPGVRPLNAYVYPNTPLDQTIVSGNRDGLVLDAFRSPGDRASAFDPDGHSNEPSPLRSTYDDVGTSYPQNYYVWRMQIRPGGNSNSLNDNIEAWRYTSRKLNSAVVDPTRLVMFSDTIATNFISDDANPRRRWQSEFDGVNKSAMGFLDGHAAYLEMESRANTWTNPCSYYGVGSLVSGGNDPNDRPFRYSFVLPQRRN